MRLEEEEMPTELAEFLLLIVVLGDLTGELDQLQQEHNKAQRKQAQSLSAHATFGKLLVAFDCVSGTDSG